MFNLTALPYDTFRTPPTCPLINSCTSHLPPLRQLKQSMSVVAATVVRAWLLLLVYDDRSKVILLFDEYKKTHLPAAATSQLAAYQLTLLLKQRWQNQWIVSRFQCPINREGMLFWMRMLHRIVWLFSSAPSSKSCAMDAIVRRFSCHSSDSLPMTTGPAWLGVNSISGLSNGLDQVVDKFHHIGTTKEVGYLINRGSWSIAPPSHSLCLGSTSPPSIQ